MTQGMREFIRSLQAEGLMGVTLLQLGPNDGLVFRVSGCLSLEATERVRGKLEEWTVKVFGHKVPCLILEEGASVEVVPEISPAMRCAEQGGIR